jgi:branched-chain amino acid transport system substrate-binding protein
MFGYDPAFSQNYTLPFFNYMMSLPAASRPQTLALIYPSDNDFSVACAQGARVLAAADGFKIVVDQGYPGTTTDFSSLVSLMKSNNAQAVVGCTWIDDSISITKAMDQFSYNPMAIYETIGPEPPTWPSSVGGIQNGVITEAFWGPDLQLNSSVAFDSAFVKMFGSQPGLFSAATAYSGLQVLSDAIKAVGSFNQTSIGLYISAHSFSTIIGTLNYNDKLNGMPTICLSSSICGIYMQQWHGTTLQTITNYTQIVYPKPPFS